MSIEAMKQALDALEGSRVLKADYLTLEGYGHAQHLHNAAIIALCQAIEQAEKQEPVAIGCYEVINEENEYELVYPPAVHKFKMVPESSIVQTFYTAPPKREWVELTFEGAMAIAADFGEMDSHKEQYLFVQAINAKLKQMNT